ncbi:FecR domain-containing protein [Novosphingobium sp. SG720]|uniref:FecR family protein n=1 Tax=Novosphingobium sp. SG720 TaxID=2586998 RepID=UPI0014464DF0|nr:FecR domain-containing protein [Novosphingobium sp. SG720]NKJ44461.1 transmembrane sensor [Novosphingobium sp. SG720]
MSADQSGAEEGAERSAREAAIAHFAARQSGRPVPVPADAKTQAALAEVEALWARLEHAADSEEIAAMRAAALARSAPGTHQGQGQRRPWLAAAAALGALAVGVGTVLAVRSGSAPTATPGAPQLAMRPLENGTAGPRTVALADGSQITLDAHTRVLLGEDATRRSAVLAQGRAFFRVAHDGARPFRVTAGTMAVTDIGTVFDVGRDGDTATVTLLEGAVDVSAPGLAPRRLAPGQRLTLRGNVARLGRADPAGTPAWQDGMIAADAEPLASLVARFNRYLARPLVLKDARAGAVPVSGAFRVDDPQALVDAVAAMGHPGALTRGNAQP